MPESDVTIYATFRESGTISKENRVTDVRIASSAEYIESTSSCVLRAEPTVIGNPTLMYSW